MIEEHVAKRETLELIMRLIYELDMGACEISFSSKEPSVYYIMSQNHAGEAQRVAVPITSTYGSIESLLTSAYKSDG
ncbi:MAG: hypothetical protein JSR78_10750 [Proteobacteria bacterium]|nr:hypothetical protein [Pseudomonadota bacterium]